MTTKISELPLIIQTITQKVFECNQNKEISEWDLERFGLMNEKNKPYYICCSDGLFGFGKFCTKKWELLTFSHKYNEIYKDYAEDGSYLIFKIFDTINCQELDFDSTIDNIGIWQLILSKILI
jgi:hypothetical protein